MRNPQQRGFTLLELLVALVVLGLLMVTLTQGIRAGLHAWMLETHVGQRSDGIETTDRALRQLVERMLPGDIRSREPPLTGSAHSMSFTTTLPGGLGAPFTHEADVTLAVNPSHRLELLWWPHYRRWITPRPPPAAITLMDNVDHIDLAFWQRPRGAPQGHWLASWSERDPPGLIRLHVAFPPGDPREWPDIVMAPMRQRPP